MYRKEYPRPQFERDNWENLNGQWEFAIDEKISADEVFRLDCLPMNIEVPFCPESKLSGIEHKGFMKSVWYRRKITISEENLDGRVIIHFGAVDYKAILYINGRKAGAHKGGYSSFSIDITDFLTAGENTIVLNAIDDTRSNIIPTGKQSPQEESFGCMYTRTTGIWQTVWLEFVPEKYIKYVKITPDIDKKAVNFKGLINRSGDYKLVISVSLRGEKLKETKFEFYGNNFNLTVPFHDIELWQPGSPVLYDVEFTLKTDGKCDNVKSYFGFRKVSFDGKKFCLNNKPIFLSQVLDQGFYPDGIYTAPTDEALKKDIEMSMELGFNGARLHEKVFEERFLYHCDRLGYLVWGEYPNWGVSFKNTNPKGRDNIIEEWKEVITRDYNHPSIIGWCPLNEAWLSSTQPCDYDSQKKICDITKAFDSTRPFIGSSGGDLFTGDVNDIHSYNHNGEQLKKEILSYKNSHPDFLRLLRNVIGAKLMTRSTLKKLPLYVSEFGGLTFKAVGKTWGYHSEYVSEEDLLNKYEELVRVIYESGAFGFCYTQLYDVEQEQNGLIRYDRIPKLSAEGIRRIKEINTKNDSEE